MTVDPGAHAREMAARAVAGNDPTGWFEDLYAEAASGTAELPWARFAANGNLIEWASRNGVQGEGKRAVVIGCGLGDDAEFLAALGFATVAFDVSPTAIDMARKRFPDSTVDYRAADLFHPPADWVQGFDLVVEISTVQALPAHLRPEATAHVGQLVAPGGTLLVIARSRPDGAPLGEGPPWPLDRSEMDAFAADGLVADADYEHIPDESGDLGRWIASFTRTT